MQRLHRKMRECLKVIADTQEKRLQLAFERIELLEKVLGLRSVAPDDAPPPPAVLM